MIKVIDATDAEERAIVYNRMQNESQTDFHGWLRTIDFGESR